MLQRLLPLVLLLLATPASAAIELKCRWVRGEGDTARMREVTGFSVDIDRQRLEMLVDDNVEWLFSKGEPDAFDKRGDLFAVRESKDGLVGGGVRAGFPHAFSYNQATGQLLWSNIWRGRINQLEWVCARGSLR